MTRRTPAEYHKWGKKVVAEATAVGGDLAKLARCMGRDYTTLLRWLKDPPEPERKLAVRRGLERLAEGGLPPIGMVDRTVDQSTGTGRDGSHRASLSEAARVLGGALLDVAEILDGRPIPSAEDLEDEDDEEKHEKQPSALGASVPRSRDP